MSKQKTARRQLAESIAKRKGIGVKSAMRYLQRIVAPEGKQRIVKPTYTGFSKYLKTKTVKEVKRVKAERVKLTEFVEPEPIEAEPWFEPDRASYGPDDVETVAVKATFDFYGSDKRHRTIRFKLQGKELNDFLNASSSDLALQTLKRSKGGSFLGHDADIYEFDHFDLGGQTHRGDYWN
jgi:hypothetical protein